MASADGVSADGALEAKGRSVEISSRLTLGRASLLMAAMVALSRLTGFGRMMVTSHLYGRNAVTDAYNAAFNIPDTISILIAGGALATGFVPVFTEYLSQGRQDEARRTFRAMWTLLGATFGLLTLALFALTFTPWGEVLALKQVQPEVVSLYLHLLRILLAAQFFFVLGGMFTGTLNALRLFWYPALQPVAFNLGIIVFGLLLPALFGMGIESQAWGALIGALIGSIAIQIPAVWRNGLSLRPLWDINDEGVRRVLKSLGPIVFGLASGQIIALNLPRFLAGGLGEGDLTALDNANRLMQLPLAVFASGPAIALFPTLSLLASQKDFAEMRVQLALALRRTLLLLLLATALLAAVSAPLVQLLLEHGKFTRADTRSTALVLMCYCAGIAGLGAQQFLARGFYALGDTRAPITIGLASMAIFGTLGLLLMQLGFGAPGLALAASVAVTILGAWMWLALCTRLGGWDEGATRGVLLKGAAAALAAGLPAFALSQLPQWLAARMALSHTLQSLVVTASLIAALVAGTGIFVAVASALRVTEVDVLTQKFARFSRRRK